MTDAADIPVAADIRVRCTPDGTVWLLLVDDADKPMSAIGFCAHSAVALGELLTSETEKAVAMLQAKQPGAGHG